MTATTKKHFLTTLALLFDPLGYHAPTAKKMRPFLQNLQIQEKGCNGLL